MEAHVCTFYLVNNAAFITLSCDRTQKISSTEIYIFTGVYLLVYVLQFFTARTNPVVTN